MSTQKAKFELFSRLARLGFTFEESAQLRRIEMTLQRWAEAECNGEIARDETTGKPVRVSQSYFGGLTGKRCTWPIADREAGALRRLKAIVDARNAREQSADARRASHGRHVFFYNQTDPRGCAVYLITREQLGDGKIDSCYTRGLAVCC